MLDADHVASFTSAHPDGAEHIGTVHGAYRTGGTLELWRQIPADASPMSTTPMPRVTDPLARLHVTKGRKTRRRGVRHFVRVRAGMSIHSRSSASHYCRRGCVRRSRRGDRRMDHACAHAPRISPHAQRFVMARDVRGWLSDACVSRRTLPIGPTPRAPSSWVRGSATRDHAALSLLARAAQAA